MRPRATFPMRRLYAGSLTDATLQIKRKILDLLMQGMKECATTTEGLLQAEEVTWEKLRAWHSQRARGARAERPVPQTPNPHEERELPAGNARHFHWFRATRSQKVHIQWPGHESEPFPVCKQVPLAGSVLVQGFGSVEDAAKQGPVCFGCLKKWGEAV